MERGVDLKIMRTVSVLGLMFGKALRALMEGGRLLYAELARPWE